MLIALEATCFNRDQIANEAKKPPGGNMNSFDGSDDQLLVKDKRRHDNRLAKGKGKLKYHARAPKLTEAEQDYYNNIDVEHLEAIAIDAEQLLSDLDAMNFGEANCVEDLPAELLGKNTRRTRTESPDLANEPELYSITTFNQLNRDLKIFIRNDDESIFDTAPAPPEIRIIAHQLGSLYRLKSYSVGKKDEKRVVFVKEDMTTLFPNINLVDKVLESGNKAIKWLERPAAKGKRKPGHGRLRMKSSSKGSILSRPSDGDIVAQHSKPIACDNVGSLMLRKMGWQPGDGLGKDKEGILGPVVAVVKTRRTGLA